MSPEIKGYGFMSFARSMSKNNGKKLVDTTKKSATDAKNTASKTAIQKTAEATGDLIVNKITSVSKKKSNNNNDDVKLKTWKKKIHIT